MKISEGVPIHPAGGFGIRKNPKAEGGLKARSVDEGYRQFMPGRPVGCPNIVDRLLMTCRIRVEMLTTTNRCPYACLGKDNCFKLSCGQPDYSL
jgi:hypothetical protein